MNSLFSQDSTLMRGLTRFADVMILNGLFIATALPIVTLGAALTALHFTAMRIASGECNAVTGDYFRSFRRNFRQATLLFAILAALAAVLAAWYVVVTNLNTGALVELLLLAVWYGVAFYFAITVLFAFPYLARFDGRIRDVLRNARLMSLRHPLVALGGLLLIGLSLAVTAFYPAATGYGMAWVFFGFAGIAVAQGALFNLIFNRYIAAAAAAQS